MWEPRRLTTLWASTACYRDSLTFFTLKVLIECDFVVYVKNGFEAYWWNIAVKGKGKVVHAMKT
jgi:hypothetical protein